MPSTFGIVSSAATFAHPKITLSSGAGAPTATYTLADGFIYAVWAPGVTSATTNYGLPFTVDIPGQIGYLSIGGGGAGGAATPTTVGGGGGGGGGPLKRATVQDSGCEFWK